MICHHGWVHVHPQAQEKQYLSLSVPSFPGKALGLQFFRTSFMPHVKKKSEGVSVIIYFACGPGRLQREDCVEAARLGSEFRCGINTGRVRVISQEVGCATNWQTTANKKWCDHFACRISIFVSCVPAFGSVAWYPHVPVSVVSGFYQLLLVFLIT